MRVAAWLVALTWRPPLRAPVLAQVVAHGLLRADVAAAETQQPAYQRARGHEAARPPGDRLHHRERDRSEKQSKHLPLDLALTNNSVFIKFNQSSAEVC